VAFIAYSFLNSTHATAYQKPRRLMRTSGRSCGHRLLDAALYFDAFNVRAGRDFAKAMRRPNWPTSGI